MPVFDGGSRGLAFLMTMTTCGHCWSIGPDQRKRARSIKCRSGGQLCRHRSPCPVKPLSIAQRKKATTASRIWSQLCRISRLNSALIADRSPALVRILPPGSVRRHVSSAGIPNRLYRVSASRFDCHCPQPSCCGLPCKNNSKAGFSAIPTTSANRAPRDGCHGQGVDRARRSSLLDRGARGYIPAIPERFKPSSSFSVQTGPQQTGPQLNAERHRSRSPLGG